MPLEWPGEFQITSAPVVSRGVVIVGSAIADNRRVDAPLGTVRAFDARTGRRAGVSIRWSMTASSPATPMSGRRCRWTRSAGWCSCRRPRRARISGAASGPATTTHANSVVALRAETGELVWSFQTVHHDVWDYDLPAQPTLARIDTGEGMRDVVIQPTKQGFVFVLDRDTGKPVWPVEERAVPQGGAEGEQLSPTQPFPTHVPALVPQQISADDVFGLIPFWDRGGLPRAGRSRAQRGPLHAAVDAGHAGVSDDRRRRELGRRGVRSGQPDPLCQHRRARPHRQADSARREADGFKPPPGHDFGPQHGAPFAMTRAVAMSPLGLLCNKPPWGEMVAVDLKAGKILWRSPVGTTEDRAPLGIAFNWGTPLVNGVAITAGGLVFTGAMDAYLRAFDARSGQELWQGRLPVPGVANPMTYLWKGEQYVAIGAGGHSEVGHHDRRQRGGVPAGAAGRSALAVVAHHRPARRAIHERGDRGRVRGAADGGLALALAAEQGWEGVRVAHRHCRV